MVDRYKGREDLTSIEQVVRYLVDNYVDSDGERLGEPHMLLLCQHDLTWEWIQAGVARRTFVYYIGDMIADHAKLDEIPDDIDWEDEDDEDDEDDDEEAGE